VANNADDMRKLLNLMENMVNDQPMDPSLAKYIANYPNEVFDTARDAMAKIIDDAEGGSRFAWGIARLPDGRFITGFPRHLEKWNLEILAQGTSTDDDLGMDLVRHLDR